MGVGSLVALGMTSVVFFFIFEVLPEWKSHSRWRMTQSVGLPLQVDDPDHPLAEMRAWDRRLIAFGMLPIYNFDDPFTIRVSDGTKYYLTFTIDERKHLVLRHHKVLSQSEVQEDARSSHDE